MPDRNKILIGAGVVWAISVCCLLFKRKLSTSAAFLGLTPTLPDSIEKMNNEEDGKETSEDAGPSMEYEATISNETSCENNLPRQWAPNFMTGASPPKFVSLEEIVHAANGMKNMALAHEIAVDKNFQLQKLIEEEEGDSLQKKVKEIVHKAFWNVLADQLAEDPPNYTQALILLKEIKECLSELVMPHHTKIRDNIKEVLDVDLIKQQAEKGILDFQYYSRYVLGVMGKLCAPVRDERIKELNECTDVIETFKGIMEVLQLMRLDLANFTITMMRPNIVASSIEYEKTKFAEFLKVQADGLQYTRRWLLKHFDEEKSKASTDPNAIKQVTHYLLAEAYLDLLEWDSSPNAETLMLDQGRLLDLRDKMSCLNIVGSILLLVNNTVGAPIHGISSFKRNIKQHLAALLEPVHSNKDLEKAMPNIVLQVKKDVNATLKEVGSSEMSPAMESLLTGQIQDLANQDHKVRRLVTSRIREFLQKIILSQSAVHQQIPPGLSSLQEELASIAARFFILVAHNRSVFGEYYQQIVADQVTKQNDISKNDDIVMES